MRQKITQTVVRSLPVQEKPYDVYDTQLPGFVVRVRPSGTRTYMVAYDNLAGKSQNYTIGKDGKDGITATSARTIAEDLKHQIRKGEDPHAAKKLRRQIAVNDYKSTGDLYLRNRYKPFHLEKRTPGGATEGERVLTAHFGHLLAKPLSDITISDVETWQSTLQNKGRDKETIKRCRAELEVFIKRAVTDGYLKKSPLENIQPIASKTNSEVKTRFLSVDESQRLYNAMRERDAEVRRKSDSSAQWRADRGYAQLPPLPSHFVDHLEPMVIISLKTGVRRNELFTLLWSDIKADYSCIHIRAEVTKSRKPRTIPLSASAKDTLKRWRTQANTNRIVFPNRHGEPFKDIKKSWKSLLRRAEIVSFRWHDLRHDFASQLVIRNISIEKVAKLLGHADIKTTQRYAHLSDDSLAKAVKVLDDSE